jgi:hypothetical protein
MMMFVTDVARSDVDHLFVSRAKRG